MWTTLTTAGAVVGAIFAFYKKLLHWSDPHSAMETALQRCERARHIAEQLDRIGESEAAEVTRKDGELTVRAHLARVTILRCCRWWLLAAFVLVCTLVGGGLAMATFPGASWATKVLGLKLCLGGLGLGFPFGFVTSIVVEVIAWRRAEVRYQNHREALGATSDMGIAS